MFMASSLRKGIGVASAGAHLVPARTRFEIHPDGDPRRAQVEEFIGRVYARRLGACVLHSAPEIVHSGAVDYAEGIKAECIPALIFRKPDIEIPDRDSRPVGTRETPCPR